WRSDGTDAGTFIPKDIYIPSEGFPKYLTAIGTTLFFECNYDQVWKSDGTAAGTVLVKDLGGTGPSGSATQLTTEGGTLYFSGFELWKTDGTASGTVMVKDINPGAGSSFDPSYGAPAVMNGVLYFAADDGAHGRELWKSDGTAAGTVMVYDYGSGTFPGLQPRY